MISFAYYMINEIKNMILEQCKDKDWDWKSHIESVVKYSKLLAKKLDADEEVCEISAWLHDIKKIKGEKENHHVHGSEEAAEILKAYNYPEDKIEKIKHCILTHSSDKNYMPESKEAKIIASADALSHFDNFMALADHVFRRKKMSILEANDWLINKYKVCWDKLGLVPEAKEIAKEKYDAIKLILGEQN